MHRSVGYLLVAAQFGLSALLVLGTDLRSAHNGIVLLASALLAGIGAALAIWAWLVMGLGKLSLLPHVKPNAELVTAPPYRLIRHPMYSGLLLFCIGALVAHLTPVRFVLWGLLLATLILKSRVEERMLAERFAEYAEYKRRTWCFVPLLY